MTPKVNTVTNHQAVKEINQRRLRSLGTNVKTWEFQLTEEAVVEINFRTSCSKYYIFTVTLFISAVFVAYILFSSIFNGGERIISPPETLSLL